MAKSAFQLEFRLATESDLERLVQLLADDPLGRMREDTSKPVDACYQNAMQAILDDSNNELIVVEKESALIGMLQLTFIPYLSRKGS